MKERGRERVKEREPGIYELFLSSDGASEIAEMSSHKTLFLVLSPEGASENRGESGHGERRSMMSGMGGEPQAKGRRLLLSVR